MTETDFEGLAAQGYNRIPLVRETLADLETALSIYLKLAGVPGSYLLESVIGGERFGRFSIIGLGCRERLTVRGHEITLTRDGELVTRLVDADPLAFIDAQLAAIKAAPLPDGPRFCGGWVGYFGYDAVRLFEHKLACSAPPDPLGLPEIALWRSEELAIIDNLTATLYLVVYADPAASGSFATAKARLAQLEAQLANPSRRLPAPLASAPAAVTSNIGEDAFLATVARAKQYIVDGDIMQVQISQRLTQPYEAPPIHLYRALRSINPSPYMYFLDLGEAQIVGASPEILVRREGDRITLRPIAGTRKRGDTPERDQALERELVSDPKERAEHVMLIDLGRNDVGRVAKIGTVKVTDTMVVERYSHVMHMVSNVEGEAIDGLTPMQLLAATFPAGTVTGTPKVRAMEIIDELEPVRRGVYAGAVGYLGYNGNMDLAIAIRTGVIKDGQLHVQAAAGVVADSQAPLEWLETNNKARAVLRAADWVRAGLVPDR
jgi:anthranilate synthase component 1